MIEINEKNHDRMLSDSQYVIIKFSAPWCGPCRRLKPTVEKIEQNHKDVVFCEANTDDCQDMAVKYRVSAVPTLVFIKFGNPVPSLTLAGIPSEIHIERHIGELMK